MLFNPWIKVKEGDLVAGVHSGLFAASSLTRRLAAKWPGAPSGFLRFGIRPSDAPGHPLNSSLLSLCSQTQRVQVPSEDPFDPPKAILRRSLDLAGKRRKTWGRSAKRVSCW